MLFSEQLMRRLAAGTWRRLWAPRKKMPIWPGKNALSPNIIKQLRREAGAGPAIGAIRRGPMTYQGILYSVLTY